MLNQVKCLGRTYEINDTIWCAFSGTGVEFEYTGGSLDITIVGDDAAHGDRVNMARVGIYINDKRVIDDLVDAPTKTYNVIQSTEPQKATVRIIKLSETAMSTFGIRPIPIAGGGTMAPTAPKAHKIEFIGDSITCGYGVDDEVAEHTFRTGTEDVTRAYAYKSAGLLDADYSIVSISGYGIISGYTDDPAIKIPEQTLQPYYEKLGFSYQSFDGSAKPQDLSWDFSLFQPEAVVINLGTNDASYCQEDSARQQEYSREYTKFLKTVRRRNPDADIFCVLGLMGQTLCKAMEQAAADYTSETGDARIHCVRLPEQDASLGYVADWHPTAANHDIAAKITADAIRTVMSRRS